MPSFPLVISFTRALLKVNVLLPVGLLEDLTGSSSLRHYIYLLREEVAGSKMFAILVKVGKQESF